MHSMDSNDGKDGGLVDLGGRSSSVSKQGCGDVVLWEYQVLRMLKTTRMETNSSDPQVGTASV